MRPLLLRMSAFGPYAEVQVLDFRELRDKRFFLIHGPTGAGKTSILDAMTYALYGSTSGEDRSGDEMRSHFARPDLATEITFEFSIGTELYRVWRRPRQQRPKARGEGTTTVNPDAALWCRTACGDDAEEGEVVASGVRDVAAAIQELLGFSAEQFRQVVVLPQGRFREVLSADVKQREEILRQLFRTERFAGITEYLKQRRAELDRQMKSTYDRRTGVLEGAGVDSKEDLQVVVDERSQRSAELAVARDAAKQRVDAALAALDGARVAHAALQENDDAKAALQALLTQAPHVEQLRSELSDAKRAQRLDAPLSLRDQARSRLVELDIELEAVAQQIPELARSLDKACELAQEAEGADKDAREADLLDSQAAQAARDLADLQRIADATRDLVLTRAAVEEAQRRTESARVAAEEAVQELEALESQWRMGRAAALAAHLEPGDTCPVCGSTEHPELAFEAEPVADSLLDEAKRRASATATTHATATAAVEAALEAHAKAEHRLEAERNSVTDPDADIEQARLRVQDLVAQAARKRDAVAQAAVDIDDCRRRKEQATLALSKTQAQAQTVQAARDAASLELERAQTALADALATQQFVDETRLADVRRTASEIDALEGRVATYDQKVVAAQERVERAREVVEKVTASPDVPSLESAHEAAAQELSQATQLAAAAASEHQRFVEALGTVEAIEGQSSQLLARYANVARLADVAEGDNALRLSFQRYVLGTYLDEVLEHASHRLFSMTAGRYRLQRDTDVKHRGRAAGLDLAVYDEQSGTTRPAGTLSGGEGFLASLALALGLAEAVQSHAGGVRLETIFIDEGFGTLDPESLELAITTLLELAGAQVGAGRLVGIISHVPELQQQIDARLEVERTDRGSTARFVV